MFSRINNSKRAKGDCRQNQPKEVKQEGAVHNGNIEGEIEVRRSVDNAEKAIVTKVHHAGS